MLFAPPRHAVRRAAGAVPAAIVALAACGGTPSLPASPEPVIPVALGEGVCDTIFNTQQCARAIEARQLEHAGRARRTPQGLCFSLIDDGQACMPDDTTATWPAWFSYLGTTERPPLHVVWAQHPEGNSVVVVNAHSGILTWLDALPHPSPTGTWVAVASSDLMAEYNPTRFTLWKVEGDSLRLAWALQPHGWGPAAVSWQSDSAVAVTVARLDAGTFRERVTDTVRVVRRNAHWGLTRPPRD